LRGARYTAPYGNDGRIASLAEFVQTVVTMEFDGEPLDNRELLALTRYVLDLDFLPNAQLDRRGALTASASPAAKRGASAFALARPGFGGMSCATCHAPSSFFRDGRVHRIGTGASPSPNAMDGGYETPTLLGLAETAPYFHDGRFATIAEVVGWFDESFRLRMTATERADLTAYVEAVGAVDRREDDRPLARRLDSEFAYIALLVPSENRAAWTNALEAVKGVLASAPPPVAARASALAARLVSIEERVLRGALLPALAEEARALRVELARLAADWAGAVATAP
jgi:hypothetical protein